MPLLDHFHPPLSLSRHWESFHASWATEMMALNRGVLPPGYFAETQVHIGSRVEIDVASFEHEDPTSTIVDGGVALQTWSPPVATLVMPAVFPDEIEVQVFSTATGVIRWWPPSSWSAPGTKIGRKHGEPSRRSAPLTCR